MRGRGAAPLEAVRYLRCEGSRLSGHKGDEAATLFLRIESRDGADFFAGYILLSAATEVIEKSDHYGQYEGEVRDVAECIAASRAEFAAAWQRRYAKRTVLRRFLSWMNGCRDRADPSARDGPNHTTADSN